jgi:K319-like protein
VTKRVSILGVSTLGVALVIGLGADTTPYAVTARKVPHGGGAPAEYQAENPANGLRFAFPVTGVTASPDVVRASAWTLDLRLKKISFDVRFARLHPARLSASENRVEYDLGTVRVAYVNTPAGLEQRVTIAAPEGRGSASAPSVVGLDFSIDGGLTPVKAGYFIDLIGPAGDRVLRYGPVDARGADGTSLSARLEVASDDKGSVNGARVVIDAVQPAYPIEVSAVVSSAVSTRAPRPTIAVGEVPGEIVGVPVTLQMGITESVDQIMARERLMPPEALTRPRETHHEIDEELELQKDPNAPPPRSHWPPIAESSSVDLVGAPSLPQSVGTSFKAVGIGESGFIPPDSMGDVGPTQILTHVNGRIRAFDKTGAIGNLDASSFAFWSSLNPRTPTGDSQVRYDRLSGRWFVLTADFTPTNNMILLAVSSGPTIDFTNNFTFYSFLIGSVLPADSSNFCDYPGFGVDANALYIGCNEFNSAGAFQQASAFVIRKSSVLAGGPMVVTGFSPIGSPALAGPFAPRGVDNDDPTWTEGYIIGTDAGFLNRINIRRVSDPGGTPTLGANVILPVSSTNIFTQPANSSTTNLDVLTLRLFAASIHKNKLTGVTSLWTAHSVETDDTCTPSESAPNRRIGAKWYEIATLTTTPTITQFGTLCSTSAGTGSNLARGFIFPTVVETGQGHMALASSYASASEFAGVAAAGRLRTDPLGGTRAPETIAVAGLQSYVLLDTANRNRWGDYSFTDVDPNDDQTVWTFQEYADTPPNNWSVRAIQLKAPPPPSLVTTSGPVCAGGAAVPVTINGANVCTAPTCTNGLCTGGQACPEFFDPGPDTGGPGFVNHISATVTGGVTVNSASIVLPANPATQRVVQVALSLNTIGTALGTKSVTITNPDGQFKTGNSLINVVANSSPVSDAGGPYSTCQASSVVLNGTGSADPDAPCGDSVALYEWDLNNDGTFDVTGASPVVTSAQLVALGLGAGPHTIKLRVTDTHSATNTASGTLTILVNGLACSDGNACTQSDTCQSGVCVGSNPVTCSASDQCHAVGVCSPGTGVCSNPTAPDGTACSDGSACTLSDACQSGTCVGANPVVCSPSDQCHVAGVCDPGTGVCPNPSAPDGASCIDGNACTQTDVCQSGVCTGSNSVVCTASDQCHAAGICNPGTGACSNPSAPDGTSCDDGNACTVGDTCGGGACVGTAITIPTETQNVSVDADKATYSWSAVPDSTRYDVLRGDLGSLPVGPAGADESCFDDLSGPTLSDTTSPTPGTGFWYLSRGENTCGIGTYGTQSDGTPRISTTCP